MFRFFLFCLLLVSAAARGEKAPQADGFDFAVLRVAMGVGAGWTSRHKLTIVPNQ